MSMELHSKLGSYLRIKTKVFKPPRPLLQLSWRLQI